VALDCQRCGACCCNTLENVAIRFDGYVEIDDASSRLLTDRSLRKKLVMTDARGVPHMRLLDDRCAALRGRVGDRVRCTVYAHRPRACRRVQPGDPDCLRARAERFG
jgi:Fe-S-cluster containining protein